MGKQHLSGKDRIRLALQHQETDRIPIAMVCSGINEPARREFDDYLKREKNINMQEYLDSFIDIQMVVPDYIGPILLSGEDIWGVKRKAVSYGSGSYNEIAYHPLADVKTANDLQNYNWPIPELFHYSMLAEKAKAIQQKKEQCLMIANANIFETSWFMRGFEQIFMDMATNPELVHAIFERVTDFFIEYYRNILSAAQGMIDLCFTADDIAGQNGLLMSIDMYKQFIKPYHVRLNTVIHEFDAQVIYHTDGAVMDAVPELIDMGIDVLQALQFDAKGMDPAELKEKYAHKLCFQGGVSVQKTLPFRNTKDVREEVEQLILTLGRNGGYILGPSHAIQAGTPPENIFTMFETALHYYPYVQRMAEPKPGKTIKTIKNQPAK